MIQSLGDGEGAGRLKCPLALDLHQAHAARALRRQRRMVTQDRDVDAIGRRRLVDGLEGLSFELTAVDGDIHGWHAATSQTLSAFLGPDIPMMRLRLNLKSP